MDKNVIKQIILAQQEFVGKVNLIMRNIPLEDNANYVLVGIRQSHAAVAQQRETGECRQN